MKTTISVEASLRDELAKAKPDPMTWDEYLALLLRSVDYERFVSLLDEHLDRVYKRSVREAVRRAEEMTVDAARTYDVEEARTYLRRRTKRSGRTDDG